MQVSVQNGEGLERRMTVELPAEEINREVENRLKKIARTARMDGFRPGKVPMRILRNRYAGQVQQEVFGEMVETSFGTALGQEQLRPAGQPSIEADVDQAANRFAYTAVFEVLPQIELGSLAESKVQRPHAEVTEPDVDDMIERLRKQRRTWQDVERQAQNDDQVRISFKGTIEGEDFEGGSAEDVPLVLGSGSMIEGFESGLVGAAAGENRTLELQFPADYRVESLAGKPVRFEVEVLKVAEPLLPGVDAEFAKSFGVDDGDLERMRQEIRGNMERELRQHIKSKVKNQAMEALLAANEFEVPKALVEQEIDALLEQTRQQYGGAGKMELPRDLFKEQAEHRVKLGLLIAEVVKRHGIEVDQARVDSVIEEMAAGYEDPKEVVEFYKNNRQQRGSMENLVLEDQVVDWILEETQLEELDSTFKEVTEGEE